MNMNVYCVQKELVMRFNSIIRNHSILFGESVDRRNAKRRSVTISFKYHSGNIYPAILYHCKIFADQVSFIINILHLLEEEVSSLIWLAKYVDINIIILLEVLCFDFYDVLYPHCTQGFLSMQFSYEN